MLNPDQLAQKVGRKVVFVGTYCYSWTVQDFQKCAANAKAMGFDTICPKRADGINKWYVTPGHLMLERQAVLSEGVGFLPFTYNYAPLYNSYQGEAEVAAEIAEVCDGMVVLDLEVEWNGKPEAAQTFAVALKNAVKGDVMITTWADPDLQNFDGVLKALDPVTSAWIPQEYTNWLGTQESEYTDQGISNAKLFPAIDITGEYANTSPITLAVQALQKGHTSLFAWEYQAALANMHFIQGVLSTFGTNKAPVKTVIPYTPSKGVTAKKNPQWNTYTIQEGDSLSGIAVKLGLVDWNKQLYQPNKATLDHIAQQHGYTTSNNGNTIFPGTVLNYIK